MKNKAILIFLFLASLIPLLDLIQPGFPVTHDGQDHVARIANFYQNLIEGNIVPRWAGNLNWGYGHPILMFLYPLPSYLASFFHFLGFSLIESTKLVFAFAFIASGFTMYLWVKNFLGKEAGFIAGILYMFAPYRFVDLYVRGAIGEHMAFIFPPLVLYFLLKSSKKYLYAYLIGGGASLAGLILSHNAISLMFLPLVILYGTYLAFHSKYKIRLLSVLLFILFLGFGLASFFWIPAFFEGKYTLRDIVTKGTYVSSFVPFGQFVYGQWNYGGSGQFTVQLGMIQWVVTILSLPLTLFFYRKKNKLWIITLSLFLFLWFTLFLMTTYSLPIWQKITTLQKFQFPWRFLSVVVFITSVFGGLLTSVIPNRLKTFAVLLLIFIALFLNRNYWHAKNYSVRSEDFFNSIYSGTTDTGESAPIWSVRFMEKRPNDQVEIISGEAVVKKVSRNIIKHDYEIIAQDVVRIRENTLYFPGWKVLVDGKEVNIEFQDPENRGLITFYIPSGKHFISVVFEETKVRFFASLITILSFLSIIFYSILKIRIWRRFRLF